MALTWNPDEPCGHCRRCVTDDPAGCIQLDPPHPCEGCEDGTAQPGRLYCDACVAEFERDWAKEAADEVRR